MEFWSIGDSSLDLIIWWTWSGRNLWKWSINQKALCITDSRHWWLLAHFIGLLISIAISFWWVRCFDGLRSCYFTPLPSYCGWRDFGSAFDVATIVLESWCCLNSVCSRESLCSGKWNFDARSITNLLLAYLGRVAWWTRCYWSQRKMLLFCVESIIWWILLPSIHSFVGHFHMWVVNIGSWWTFVLAYIYKSSWSFNSSMSASNWTSFGIFCWTWANILQNLSINKPINCLLWCPLWSCWS